MFIYVNDSKHKQGGNPLKMNQNDIKLKRTAQLVGIALLVFLILFYGANSAFALIATPIISEIFDETLSLIIIEVTSGIIYAASFILPALLFAHLNRNEKAEDSVHDAPRFPAKLAPFIIMATVAIAISCAYVNSWLGTVFGIADGLESTTEEITPLTFVLLTFTTAIVPAICEEFLFRKTLIPALSPYGQGFAIFSSALFFGLMHQNLLQIFYTTMAGILLGYVYAKARSYLCVFLIHFANNFVSILQTTFASNLDETSGYIAVITLTATVLVLGAISIFILVLKEKNKKDIYATGSFEKILEPSANVISRSTLRAPYKTLFLSPSVLIFVILVSFTYLLQLFS